MSRKLLCYYAHNQGIYDTPQEARDVETLEKAGFDVVNPNSPEIKQQAKEQGMSIFEPLVKSCEVFAFRALPGDLAVPAGVAQEYLWAKEVDAIILELPSSITRRMINVEETREYLREVGQR